MLPFDDVVIRRVRRKPTELLGDVRVAVLVGPQLGDQEVREADHVQQRHRAPHGSAEIRTLSQRCADEQPAVRAAGDAQPIATRSAAGHQPIRRRVEVVEHVLLVLPPAGVVPLLALLQATAESGNGEQPTLRAPRRDHRRPQRRLGDREPAVAVEDRGRVSVGNHILAVNQEQPDRCAVEGGIRHLAHGQSRDRLGRFLEATPALDARRRSISVERSRLVETGNDEQRCVSPGVGSDTRDRDDAELGARPERLPIRRPAFDTVNAAAGDHDQDFITAGRGAADHVGAFWHDGAPVVEGRGCKRSQRHPPSRRVSSCRDQQGVAPEPERRHRLDAADDGGPGVVVAVEQESVDSTPTDKDHDEQVAAVGRCVHVGPRLWRGSVAPHELIIPAGAEAVVQDPPVVLIAGWIRRVVKSACVGQPCDRRSSRVPNRIGEVFTCLDIQNRQRAFLGAAFADAVGDQPTVAGRLEPVERRRRIGRRRARVDQRDRGCSRVGGRTQHQRILLCPGCPLQHEQSIAAHLGLEHDRPAHQRDESLIPPATIWLGIERLTGALVLQCHPLDGGLRFAILEPPIRIGNGNAVIQVGHHQPRSRRRYGEPGVSHAPCWDAYRGSPSSGAFSPFSSSCAST